jgi:hypothetical protein
MTKQVYIINGDSSMHEVDIVVQERINNEWTTVETLKLNSPGELLTKFIWKERRLIVMERT